MTDLTAAIEAALASRFWGRATAAKRGRNPAFPYVPVVDHTKPGVAMRQLTKNPLKGCAYATREEAVARAQAHIDAQIAWHRTALAEPRYRALRLSFNLPREIAESSK